MTPTRLAGSALVVLALASCSSSTPSTPSPSAAAAASSPASPAPAASSPASPAAAAKMPAITELKVATTSLGMVVADGGGRTLYMFTKDTVGATTTVCTGACEVAWPYTVADAVPKLTGVTGTVTLIKTPDGRSQVTLNGLPLYYFAKDTKAGDVTGQGVGSVWYVLDPTGTVMK